MKIETSWLTPPTAIGGLDHLGTQAPCLLIYGQLLPGITNVTDRARYYSLYPWIVWSYDRRYSKEDATLFVEYFRRADCLLTLIAERHARQTDNDNERHGAAMVGRIQLLSALDRLENGQALQLSQYTAQDSSHRYFKNPLGGLGQYYAGTLAELGLMDSSTRPWFRYTKEHGAPLAEAVDLAVPGDRFWSIVASDTVTLEDLDALSAFCACNLAASQVECETLRSIFFDTSKRFGEEGAERRKSLGLIQKLVSVLPEDHDLSEEIFRACTYSGALPGGTPWQVPSTLHNTMTHWQVYVRNDLLSIACQTLLALSLRKLQPQLASERRFFNSVESFAVAFSAEPEVRDAISELSALTFGELVQSSGQQAPQRSNWEQEGHEIQLGKKLLEGWKRNEADGPMIKNLLQVIALLAFRDDAGQAPYAALSISPDALSDYPIHLSSFRQRVEKWRDIPVAEMLSDLTTWALNTHLRVALRKLRQTNRSTFHLRPSERGLEVVGNDIPPPAPTTPRFRQAVQILRDIGVLERDSSKANRQTRLSVIGRELMEAACA